jgi:acetylornithine deacetylase/succinyl-diaminopimelate desuccinylase-like protein
VGGASGHPFIVSAHLDTIFPAGTDVSPRREGGLIRAPGIADDGRGLAALLALGRVFRELEISLPYPLLFVATVGEEGAGDLRGVRYLFRPEELGGDVAGFVSLDGVGLDRIVTTGVGSRRLRLTVRGPGGHSWTDFGAPNPVHILAAIVARTRTISLPSDPRTTLTFARCGGGTSINALPREAWAEVDLRSEKEEEVEEVERGVLEVARDEVRRNGERVELDVAELGHRPAGGTAPSSRLIRAADEATRLLGVEPVLVSSSTDANVPMALGVPAITMGAGGEAGGIHTTDEWYRNRNGPAGILRAALTLLLL